MPMVECLTCGEKVYKETWQVKTKNYCSRKCYGLSIRVGKITVPCDACGKKISRSPSHIKKENFCSHKCRAKHISSRRVIDRVPVVCEICGSVRYVLPSVAVRARFCSQECSQKSRRNEPDTGRHKEVAAHIRTMKSRANAIKENIFVCKNCGKAYIRWRRSGDEGKEYCSRECFFDKIAKDKIEREKTALPVISLSEIRSLVHFNKCDVCGTMFTAKSKLLKYCSKECKNLVCAKAVREKYRKTQAIKKKRKPCEWCGKFFLGWERSRFCSKKCLSSNSHYMREPRHRARALGVYYEPVNPLKVFIRDGWRCQQCNKKLNPKNRGKMIANAPELDHILPWAQGGEHSYKNTQLLCRKCNGQKSSQPIGQMLMFGELEIRRESVGQRA